MNRTTAKQIVPLLPFFLGVIRAFPAAVQHVREVAPIMQAFGDNEAILLEGASAPLSGPNDSLTFDSPADFYSIQPKPLPQHVRVRIEGQEFEFNPEVLRQLGLIKEVVAKT